MTREELQDLLDTLGAPGPHWPEQTLVDVQALTARDPLAGQDVQRARELDNAFAELSVAPMEGVTPASTSALRERILADARNTQRAAAQTTTTEEEASPLWLRISDWWLAATWRPAMAASLMLLIGLSLGINHGQQDEDDLAADYADYADLLFAAEEPALDAQDWLTEEVNL